MELDNAKQTPSPKSKNVKVLCLGLSRTGTMSLRAAFEKLGYNGTYHYRVPSIEDPSHCDFWVSAFKAKFEDGDPITRSDFDKVYANYEVITDSPSVFFWEELLAAYPDAKVVLQTRDVDRWYKSHMVNLWPMNRDWYGSTWNPYGVLFQYFLPKDAMFTFTGLQAKYGHGLDFPETGKQRYEEHNEAVRTACKRDKRDFVEYDVRMGWGPLCGFLGKEVPQETFPRLNDTDEFQRLWSPILGEMRRDINQRIMMFAYGMIGLLLSTVLWLYGDTLRAWWG
jgi:Sulfotransferase domain